MKIILLVSLLGLVSCNESSEQQQNRKQEELNKQAVQSVGMPAIVNFSEKRHLKDILELRDQETPTTTYVRDMNGRLHKVCDSIGFGIPNSTQFTNPSQYYTNGAVLPQADPNGLYSGSSEATWVLCLNPKTGKIAPTYLEDRITVSTFELE
jgi:hypothetical protein